MDSPSDPKIQKGYILAYRVFDAGSEIDLRAVDRILKQAPGGNRLAINRTGRNALTMRNPPVQIALGEVTFRIKELQFRAELTAKVFDYAAVSLMFQIAIPAGTRWSELIPLSAALNGDTPGAEQLDEIARRRCDELAALIAPAIQAPSNWPVFEDYTIFFIESLNGIDKPSQLIDNGPIPELILGEAQDKLASKSRSGILEYVFQYAESDLAVIDWNSAIVIEPSGNRDIPDVVEFALTHLLEFRYYDELLDHRLRELYDAAEENRGEMLKSSFAKLSREANTRFLEFSEFLERIDNSLKVVGDFYTAVIYRAAIRRFRIPDWQQSLTRKMNLLTQVSQVLLSEVNTYRSHLLEVIVIVLISFEIVQAIIRSH